MNRRGRTYEPSSGNAQTHKTNISSIPSSLRRPSPPYVSSGDSSGADAKRHVRVAFTRSRSPVVLRKSGTTKSAPHSARTMSPVVSLFSRTRSSLSGPPRIVLPALIETRVRIPITSWTWALRIDTRRAGECSIILGTFFYAISKVSVASKSLSNIRFATKDAILPGCLSYKIMIPSYLTDFPFPELYFLGFSSFLYILWTHSLVTKVSIVPPPPSPLPSNPSRSLRPSSPRVPDIRENKRNPPPLVPKKTDFGFVWMSVPKNYRFVEHPGVKVSSHHPT